MLLIQYNFFYQQRYYYNKITVTNNFLLVQYNYSYWQSYYYQTIPVTIIINSTIIVFIKMQMQLLKMIAS